MTLLKSDFFVVNPKKKLPAFGIIPLHEKMIMITTAHLIQQYHLQPHPEGGRFKEAYKSNEQISANALPERFTDNRAFSTAIYFLLEAGNFSAFHRIKSDECWHFYKYDPLWIYIFDQIGKMEIICLGNDINKGQLFQYLVPANCWFASCPSPGSNFCFVGCTVAPGFDFADFELASGELLTGLYPAYKGIIKELCR